VFCRVETARRHFCSSFSHGPYYLAVDLHRETLGGTGLAAHPACFVGACKSCQVLAQGGVGDS